MQLRQIEIDFDIHQMIELERRGFEEPPYSALRRLLKLPDGGQVKTKKTSSNAFESTANSDGTGEPFYADGVLVPHGSLARMEYARGSQVYNGQFLNGKLVVNNQSYTSLSSAASALGITKKGTTTSLDGWLYWKAKFPGETRWHKLSDLRKKMQNN